MTIKDLTECNQWTAKHANATIKLWGSGAHKITIIIKGEYIEWNLADARCRQIIREHFKIDTNYHDYFRDIKCCWHASIDDICCAYAKTIEEAELECINALRLSEKNA